MTKEEAIKELKIQFVGEYDRQREAKNMAVKALKQEPCGKDINVPATDAISRQAAIDALGECPMVWMDSDAEVTSERDWLDTVKMLKSLPSVTPQPKTDVLGKIRDEIDTQDKWLAQAGYNAYNVDIVFNSIKRVIAESEDKE